MIKSVIAGAVAMAVVSFGVNAAPQGQGKVTFNGTVVDAPCGQVSKVLLNNGGSSTPKNFDIKLTDCDVTNYKKAGKAGTVSLTFSGVQAGTDMLQTVGTTNTAILVTDPHGKAVKFDGTTATGVSSLVDGDNTIHFTALVKKDTSGNDVAEGAFSAVANFNLTYQ